MGHERSLRCSCAGISPFLFRHGAEPQSRGTAPPARVGTREEEDGDTKGACAVRVQAFRPSCSDTGRSRRATEFGTREEKDGTRKEPALLVYNHFALLVQTRGGAAVPRDSEQGKRKMGHERSPRCSCTTISPSLFRHGAEPPCHGARNKGRERWDTKGACAVRVQPFLPPCSDTGRSRRATELGRREEEKRDTNGAGYSVSIR